MSYFLKFKGNVFAVVKMFSIELGDAEMYVVFLFLFSLFFG